MAASFSYDNAAINFMVLYETLSQSAMGMRILDLFLIVFIARLNVLRYAPVHKTDPQNADWSTIVRRHNWDSYLWGLSSFWYFYIKPGHAQWSVLRLIISSGYLILTCIIPSSFITCRNILGKLIEFLFQNWFEWMNETVFIINAHCAATASC